MVYISVYVQRLDGTFSTGRFYSITNDGQIMTKDLIFRWHDNIVREQQQLQEITDYRNMRRTMWNGINNIINAKPLVINNSPEAKCEEEVK